jgi:SAM-dependent methyltransferase
MTSEVRPSIPAKPQLACPACSSANARSIAIGAGLLKQCVDCGLPYAPEYADAEEIYTDGYFSGETGAFGPGDTRHPEFREFLDFVARHRMDMIERVTRRPGRMVDVGCGTGETLAEAKRRGWEVAGVDLIGDAVKMAIDDYGIDVRQSLLEDSGLPERSFDVVSATHVLEHMHEGGAFLTSIARWAKPGGYVFIEVPNWHSIDRMGNKDKWFGYRPLEHLAHYSPKTLSATMRRNGLEPVDVRTTCYQFHRQTMSQALHDLGVTRGLGKLNRDVFTVEGAQHGDPCRMPNAFMTKVLRSAQVATNVTKTGVVILMMARVP